MKVSPDGRQSYTAAEQLEKFKNRPGSMPFPVEQAAREESKSFAKRTFESGIAVDIGQIGASERGFYFGFKAGHASRDEEVKAKDEEIAALRQKLAEAEGRVANSKLSEIALSLAHEFEVAVASREPKSGMQVPPSGDFISCAQLPSAVGRMKWWAREIRKAQEPAPLPETKP